MINKKGAIELSISTIVIIVLAMSMLILGLVLIRSIFVGTTDSVITMNDNVKEEIRKLFQDEGQRYILRLSGDTATIKQGSDFGVAFGIKNTVQGDPNARRFRYTVDLSDTAENLKKNCGITMDVAKGWIRFGSGEMSIEPGNTEADRILISIPSNAPLCTTKYKIIVEQFDNGQWKVYTQPFFFVKIDSKGIFG